MSDVPYRGDREADQARIAALEDELKRARDKIDVLEGKQSQALVLASSAALATTGGKPSFGLKVAGAPMTLELTRTFDAAFPTDKFEDLVEAIRVITRDRGRTELLRTSMSWSTAATERGVGPFTSVTVSVRDGKTTLIVTDRLGQLAGAMYGGIGGGVGGGAIMLPILATMAVPLAGPVFILGWLGGVYAGTRALFKRSAKKRAQTLQRVFDAVAAEIEKTLS